MAVRSLPFTQHCASGIVATSTIACMLWLTAWMLMADHPQIVPHMLMSSWLVDAAPPVILAALSIELSIGLALVLASGLLPILVVHQTARMVVKAIRREPLFIGNIVTVTLMATGLLAFLVAAYGFEAPLLVAADAVLALGVLAGISQFIARSIEDLRRPRDFGFFAVRPNHTAKDTSNE